MLASGKQSRPQLRPQTGKSCYPHQKYGMPFVGVPCFLFKWMAGLEGSGVNACQWQAEPTTAPSADGQVLLSASKYGVSFWGLHIFIGQLKPLQAKSRRGFLFCIPIRLVGTGFAFIKLLIYCLYSRAAPMIPASFPIFAATICVWGKSGIELVYTCFLTYSRSGFII